MIPGFPGCIPSLLLSADNTEGLENWGDLNALLDPWSWRGLLPRDAASVKCREKRVGYGCDGNPRIIPEGLPRVGRDLQDHPVSPAGWAGTPPTIPR